MIYILKGTIIGIIFGAPVGAIGALTIQRTLTNNLKAGIITGLGSSVADCIYACIGAFGVTIISDFMEKNKALINICCGLLILFLGISRFFQKPKYNQTNSASGRIKMFLSAFGLGLMNPVAIMSFMIAFAYLGITDKITVFHGIFIVLGVFIGTLLWWFILLSLVEYLKRKRNGFNMKRMNQFFGIVFILFSLIILTKTLLHH